MHRERRPTFYGLVRVRAERGGVLVPLWYGVGDAPAFEQATTVAGGTEYTIAFCSLPSAATYEFACRQLQRDLTWFEPLLRGATPEARFAKEVGGIDVG